MRRDSPVSIDIGRDPPEVPACLASPVPALFVVSCARRLQAAMPADFGSVVVARGLSGVVERLARTPFRVLVVDTALLDDGARLAEATRLRDAHPRVDWLLGWPDPSTQGIELAIRFAARGAVAWGAPLETFRRAIDACSAGQLWFPRAVLQAMYVELLNHRSTPPDGRLTRREAEVLVLVRQGLTNKLIARQLRISINTVKKHVHNAFDKCGMRHRRQATSGAGPGVSHRAIGSARGGA